MAIAGHKYRDWDKKRPGGGSIELIKRIGSIVPEAMELLERRYLILRTISFRQPIGRRALSSELGISERTARSELDILRKLELLNSDIMGMYVTDLGLELLKDLNEIYKSLKGIPELTKKLSMILGVRNILIVPGNSSQDNIVLKDMGRAAAELLKKTISGQDIVGVTGGSTMAVVADAVSSNERFPKVTVIPARGGLGTDIYTQSNSIAAKIGQALGAEYKLLYIPDSLGEEALKLALSNEEIKESLNLINSMRILVFGIGRADTMAKRRSLDETKYSELMQKKTVAEAFGHYFDIEGNDIWEYKTVGLSLGTYMKVEEVIGVAGGEEKAEAIIAVSSIRKDISLVVDEAVANKIIQLMN